MKWKNKGHELENLKDIFSGKRSVYLYGAGEHAKELLVVLENVKKWSGWEIYLIDRDEEKQKLGWQGYDVMSPEAFFKSSKENFFVVICPWGIAEGEIYQLLLENGIAKKDVFRQFSFLHRLLTVYFLYGHDIVFLNSTNLCPSTICNLNCRDCLNFTPYIKNHVVMEFDQVKKDIDLYFNAVDLVYRFQITGGEPFLYKNLKATFEYIEQYRKQIFQLEMVTNGTVMPSDDICEYLAKKNILVILDDYRDSIDEVEEKLNAIRKKFDNFGVKYTLNHVDMWMRMYPDSYQVSDVYDSLISDNAKKSSEEMLIEKYTKCDVPYTALHGGKLSACNYSNYADKAGVCEADENDYFNLNQFDKERKRELVEFAIGFNEKGYTEFCKKCSGWIMINKAWCQPAIQAERNKQ